MDLLLVLPSQQIPQEGLVRGVVIERVTIFIGNWRKQWNIK